MVFFSLAISVGLYDTTHTYTELAPHMDEYTFSGTTIAEIAEKVKRVLGTDRKWTENSSIMLYYYAVTKNGKVGSWLRRWDNVSDRDTLVNLIYGV